MFSSTVFSCAAYPLTVSTRLGIRSARRESWTSMPPSASWALTSAERSRLNPTIPKPAIARTMTPTMMVGSMRGGPSPVVCTSWRSPRAPATAAAPPPTGEAAAPAAAVRLRRLVRRDGARDGRREVADHRVHVVTGAGAAVVATEVRRHRRLGPGLGAVLLGPLVGTTERDRPRDVGGV